MQQLKFNLGDTVYFFTESNQESFLNRLNLVPVEFDPYKKLIKKVKVTAIHMHQCEPTRYDVRNSEYGWDKIFEDCLYSSHDEAKTVLRELIAKRIKELTDCYLN